MFKLSWITLAVFALDQLTKYLAVRYLHYHVEVPVTSFLNLTLLHNSGAAFGFLNDAGGWQNVFFIAVAIIVSVVILGMVRRLGPNDTQTGIGLMLILGGALGNLLDRLRLGYVIDFVDFHYGTWHWYTFNVADAAITVGAVLLALDALGLRFVKRHGSGGV